MPASILVAGMPVNLHHRIIGRPPCLRFGRQQNVADRLVERAVVMRRWSEKIDHQV